MYQDSSCAHQTPQGIAIKAAAVGFGDGETLPFTPCKRGYIPIVGGKRMYGCHLHHKQRKKRVLKEGGRYRAGEKKLDDFWVVETKGTSGEESREVAKEEEKSDGDNSNLCGHIEGVVFRDSTKKRKQSTGDESKKKK